MGKTNPRQKARLRRKVRIRRKISGTTSRPRLSVFRSNRCIFAQIIDDENGHTMVSASSLKLDSPEQSEGVGRKTALAREVGKLIAARAREKGIEQVVFDRGGYLYHGRVKALAEGAREAGLVF